MKTWVFKDVSCLKDALRLRKMKLTNYTRNLCVNRRRNGAARPEVTVQSETGTYTWDGQLITKDVNHLRDQEAIVDTQQLSDGRPHPLPARVVTRLKVTDHWLKVCNWSAWVKLRFVHSYIFVLWWKISEALKCKQYKESFAVSPKRLTTKEFKPSSNVALVVHEIPHMVHLIRRWES